MRLVFKALLLSTAQAKSSQRFEPQRGAFGNCTFPAAASCHPRTLASRTTQESPLDPLLGMCKCCSSICMLHMSTPMSPTSCYLCTCAPFTAFRSDASWNTCGPPVQPARHNTFAEVARLVHPSSRWKEGLSLGWLPNRTGSVTRIPCALIATTYAHEAVNEAGT